MIESWTCLSVRPPDCLSVRPSVLLLVPMYLSIFRSIVFGTSSCFCFFCPSACLSRQTCLLVRLLVFQPACLSAHPPACLLVCLPVCLLARMSASLPACTSAYLSVFCLPSCIPAHPPSPRFFHSLYCCRLRSGQSGDGAVVQSRGCPLDVPWLWSGRRYHAPGLFLSR